jgi:hypothetical protein
MRILVCVAILIFAGLCNAATYSLVGSTGVPNVTACGAGPSVSGTDQAGVITTGTGLVTACTLNFSAPMSATPFCIVTSNSTSVNVGITSVNTAAMVLGMSVTLPGGKIYYVCVMA